MKYHQFTIHVPDESKEALISRIYDIGTLGFEERDGSIIAYFDERRDPGRVSDKIMAFRSVLEESGLNPDIRLESAPVADRDWNEEWKKSFSPLDVGKNLVVVPPWIEYTTGRSVLTIDPGQAFGIGNHETTVRCLELIEYHANRYRGGTLLDIGTGTGILAIAALKLGFAEATCVDIDPPAVEAARWNAELNSITDIDIRLGDIHEVSGSYDFITANLISEVLVGIAPDISKRTKDGGTVVLSGMLTGQEKGVTYAMEDAGLLLTQTFIDDKWVTLVLSGQNQKKQ